MVSGRQATLPETRLHVTGGGFEECGLETVQGRFKYFENKVHTRAS
jgi:hypothetical protein